MVDGRQKGGLGIKDVKRQAQMLGCGLVVGRQLRRAQQLERALRGCACAALQHIFEFGTNQQATQVRGGTGGGHVFADHARPDTENLVAQRMVACGLHAIGKGGIVPLGRRATSGCRHRAVFTEQVEQFTSHIGA